MARAVKSRVSKVVKQKAKKAVLKPVAAVKTVAAAASKKAVKAAGKAKAAVNTVSLKAVPEKKKVSERLLETIQKRKQAKEGGVFAKAPGRRGRRPKNVDYQPTNNEGGEGGGEAYVLESEYERLEYDTGIRLKEGSDDKGFNLERFEDFDEELNFDW